MKLQLYNFSQTIVDKVKQSIPEVKSDTIILGSDAIDDDLLAILKEDEITIIYMDNKTFHYGILSTLSGEPNVLCIINTSQFTEEEECTFDDCIIDFSDSVDIAIIDSDNHNLNVIINTIVDYFKNNS